MFLYLVGAAGGAAGLAVLAALKDTADGPVDTAECLLADVIDTVNEAVQGVANGVLGTLREGCRDGVGSVQARVCNIARSADNTAHGLEECREHSAVATGTTMATVLTGVLAAVLAAVLATILAAVLATILTVGSDCGHCF